MSILKSLDFNLGIEKRNNVLALVFKTLVYTNRDTHRRLSSTVAVDYRLHSKHIPLMGSVF